MHGAHQHLTHSKMCAEIAINCGSSGAKHVVYNTTHSDALDVSRVLNIQRLLMSFYMYPRKPTARLPQDQQLSTAKKDRCSAIATPIIIMDSEEIRNTLKFIEQPLQCGLLMHEYQMRGSVLGCSTIVLRTARSAVLG
jgi:hypothetical protein